MRGNNFITINGRTYDAITGMPAASGAKAPVKKDAGQQPAEKPRHAVHSGGAVVSDIAPQPVAPKSTPTRSSRHVQAAQKIHRGTQRSQTLRRSTLKPPATTHATPKAHPGRSAMIHKFAPSHPKPSPAQRRQQPVVAQPQPTRPTAPAELDRQEAKPASTHATPAKTGSELKEHLIKSRLHDQESRVAETNTRQTPAKRRPRLATIVASMTALVVLGGYLTYLNLPSLSIRVAAAQADVNANYPSYQPAGYNFAGPVAFSPGEVRIQFESNTNEYNYAVVQRSSNWDSQALLDNYVKNESEQYATLQERGLTIYIMKNKAAWVNGGTLYVIDGNAPLSSTQIQKIASSTL